MDAFTEIAKLYGPHIALLAAVLWGLYRGFKYLGEHVLTPLVNAHVQHLADVKSHADKTDEAMSKIVLSQVTASASLESLQRGQEKIEASHQVIVQGLAGACQYARAK